MQSSASESGDERATWVISEDRAMNFYDEREIYNRFLCGEGEK